MQYQWGQGNLTSQTGTAISSPNSTGTNPSPPSSNPTAPSPSEGETGVSPDDGYSTTGTGQDGVQSVSSYFLLIPTVLTNKLFALTGPQDCITEHCGELGQMTCILFLLRTRRLYGWFLVAKFLRRCCQSLYFVYPLYVVIIRTT